MIRQLSVIFLLAITIASCSEKDKIPKGILAQSKMEAVLWDLISADEFVSGYILPKDPTLDRKQESLKLYEQIFSIHKITSEEFQNSLSFYQSHPSLLLTVLDSINTKHSIVPAQRERLMSPDSMHLKVKSVE